MESSVLINPWIIADVLMVWLSGYDIFWRFLRNRRIRAKKALKETRINTVEFPTRKPFHEFVERFKILAPDAVKKRLWFKKIDCGF
nr:SBP-like protein [Tanacetum cinerariifolium]